MIFYLGTDRANWLERVGVPLFVSHRTLRGRKTMPRALGPWALDSGGFTELSMHGRWLTSEAEYVEAVARYYEEIGQLDWAAPQDWMCEPWIIEKTGLSVREHQERSIASFVSLRGRGPFVPVLQGWAVSDYFDHAQQYADAGVDLSAEKVVGIGSICRRGGTSAAEEIAAGLQAEGIRLHGFGLKVTALRKIAWALHSADSMAWSYGARRRGSPMIEGHPHRTCNHCVPWALQWRERVLASANSPQQMVLA